MSDTKVTEIFINRDGTWTKTTWFLILAIPAYFSGYIKTGHGLVISAFMVYCVDASLSPRDKYEIRFNVMAPPDIFKEMTIVSNDEPTKDSQILMDCALSALAKKYGEFLQLSKLKSSGNQSSVEIVDNLALLCQDAAYLCLGHVTKAAKEAAKSDDNAASDFPFVLLSSVLSVLALIGKNPTIQKQYLQAEKANGKKSSNNAEEAIQQHSLKLPIELTRLALSAGKTIKDDDKKLEQASAKVQRQACLWFGAMCDESTTDTIIDNKANKGIGKEVDTLAKLVAKNDGVQAAIDALSWYRCHAEVVCWALWALFQMCFEHETNAALLVNTSTTSNPTTKDKTFAVPVIVVALKKCVDNIDATRHGTALLFYLLRGKPKYDLEKVRDAALTAGLHDTLNTVMDHHGSVKDISAMAAEMLAGTGYQGHTAAVVVDKDEKKEVADID